MRGFRGVYVEAIALPCGTERYTMPLGIVLFDNIAYFRIFRGAGLEGVIRESTGLILLLPLDPLLFADSLFHSLERSRWWRGECPHPPEHLGSISVCSDPLLVYSDTIADHYMCQVKSVTAPVFQGYSRTYGCLVELLVYFTKARAGVFTCVERDVVEYLMRCIRRASRYADDRLRSRLESVMQRVLENLQGMPPCP
ncbi:MAG: DUF447 family protein [Desulfurococcales archaeon]|nr:DUF447 family protein [Desulfurococcales archaeon]